MKKRIISQECAQLLKEAAEVAPFDEVRRLDGEASSSTCAFFLGGGGGSMNDIQVLAYLINMLYEGYDLMHSNPVSTPKQLSLEDYASILTRSMLHPNRMDHPRMDPARKW